MESINARLNITLNSGSFSWKTAYFDLLHEALEEAFNEIIPTEDNADIEWKDDEAIQCHADETGLLD